MFPYWFLKTNKQPNKNKGFMVSPANKKLTEDTGGGGFKTANQNQSSLAREIIDIGQTSRTRKVSVSWVPTIYVFTYITSAEADHEYLWLMTFKFVFIYLKERDGGNFFHISGSKLLNAIKYVFKYKQWQAAQPARDLERDMTENLGTNRLSNKWIELSDGCILQRNMLRCVTGPL